VVATSGTFKQNGGRSHLHENLMNVWLY